MALVHITVSRKRKEFCHSERSEESLFLFMGQNQGEILRFAQNDKTVWEVFPRLAKPSTNGLQRDNCSTWNNVESSSKVDFCSKLCDAGTHIFQVEKKTNRVGIPTLGLVVVRFVAEIRRVNIFYIDRIL
jgi:hypothetical protein